MPSGEAKPGLMYPMHWHDCLRYLAARPSGEVLVEEGVRQKPDWKNSNRGTNDARKHAQTIRRKLGAMRKSIRDGMHRGWTESVIRMVCEDELHFEIRQGNQVWAIRRKRTPRVEELIAMVLKK